MRKGPENEVTPESCVQLSGVTSKTGPFYLAVLSVIGEILSGAKINKQGKKQGNPAL
jgi:hypothetical protein